MKKILPLFFCFFFFTQWLSAQQVPVGVDTTVINSELRKRGLSEEEVRKRLEEKGIDLENIRPQDLPRVQKQIEEVIAELEQEKAQLDANQSGDEETEPKKVTQKDRKVLDIDESEDTIASTKVVKPIKPKKKTKEEIAEEERLLKKKALEDAKAAVRDSIRRSNGITIEEAFGENTLKKASNDTIIPVLVYGQQIFRDGKLSYIKDKDFKASESYVLASGDKVTISISGLVYYNQTFTINTEGFIQPDRMPRVFLKGLTLSQARRNLQANYIRFYRFTPEDFLVSVNASRIVVVNIVGEVFKPGSFTLSAGNSAFNALVAAGGPTNIGSVRNIRLIRAGSNEKKRLDVYEFLLDPSVARDFSLFENDYISVPVAERVVTIAGAVKRPFKYELINGENLMKALTYAGGLAENAYQTTLQVKRFVNDREKIIDVKYKDLKTSGGDFELLNGDSVVVKSIPTIFENYANVIGAVDLPGKYEITEGMTIKDVLLKAVLKKEARTDVAYLQRTNADQTLQLKLINIDEVLKNSNAVTNLILQPKDRLLIYNKESFVTKDSVFVTGAVKTPLRFPFDPSKSIRITDMVNLAGGLKPEATDFAYIVRRDPNNAKLVEYKRVELKKAQDNPNSDFNIYLQANDELRIQSRVTYVDEAYVRISGAIRIPGEYKWDETLTLRDVLTLSGGLKIEAAANRVDISRVQLSGNEEVRTVVATVEVDKNLNFANETAGNFPLQPYDQIVVRSIPEFGFQKMINITGEVKYPGQYALIDKNERVISILQRAGGLSPEAFPSGATLFRSQDNIGYVIFKLEDAIKNQNSNHNIILKEGDIIDIPKNKDIVTIRGATQMVDLYPDKILASGKINVAFQGNNSAWYYVDKYAAGVGKEGRKRLISVEHPNGQIQRTKDFLLFKVYPKVQKGSIISVGYAEKKKEVKKGERKEVDWGKVLADSIAQATALLSFILLIQRLN
ncbi:MAG: SLBB domain-containing protein [Saprospiraceae bacterium]|nr:SLBB domain-containing protein [Saprospiraceae bacterium]